MRVFQHTIVLLLLAAAGVIFPLRRAQQAFHARSDALGFSSTRRPAIRRRVGGPRFDFKRGNPANAAFATDGAADLPRVVRRRLTFASAAEARHFRSEHRHSSSWTPAAAQFESWPEKTTAHAPAPLDCLVPAAPDRLPQPECIQSLTSSPPLAVATQAVAEAPVPPPRC